ncbi:serine/threonine-protein kinase RIO2 [Haladaptatus sp. ZSTT2]|uniref:serine/threonine-protein kinase RIO2 n=1 Tax=Haladaptatus sp. ZSTT2 TaxID=3120515 RepID=UPI00300F0F7B
MVRNVAPEMANLEPEDFYLLSGIEHGMRFSKWVNREKLPEFANLTEKEVDYRIDRCHDRELIERKTQQYEGYRLTFEGYDALALRTFSERDTIRGFGAPLGVGKESDVYEVQSYKPLALKYHREGFTNFREVQKERDYTADNQHVSWQYTARKAAEREYEVLETLYPDVHVPRPIDHNRHAIIMDKIDGVELSRAALEPDQVVPVLDLIVGEMQGAYARGYVHSDMSAYNVFVGKDGVTIFDWPQAVATDHENAPELLARDLKNIVQHFQQKYPQQVRRELDVQAIVDAVVAGEFETIEAAA